MAIDIGISEEDRKSIVEGLSRLLADTYVLYLKTHNFHWNVTGPMFRTSLVDGQEAVTRTARGIFPLLDKVSDEPTADLLTQRMQVHEKTAWMLRAMLEGK